MQIQGSKDLSHPKKIKPKDLKSALLYDDATEWSKKDNRKDKKKRFQGQRREHIGEWKEQTLVTNINTTNVSKKKKKRRDISEITYFNCDKKSHFASNCIEPKN